MPTDNSEYPVPELFDLMHDFYARINGKDSISPERNWADKSWNACVRDSRGVVFEKAGFACVNVVNGFIGGKPGRVSLIETIAYPANPCIPAFIIMSNMHQVEDGDASLVLYTDLILQDGQRQPHVMEKFHNALEKTCMEHQQDFKKFSTYAANPTLLGGARAGCGILAFFPADMASFVAAAIRAALSTYEQIVTEPEVPFPDAAVSTDVYRSRARMIEWIMTGDFGIQVARENGIPLEVVEAYGFPPVVHY